MWTRVYSKFYQGVKKEDVWRVWADVNNWPKWHDDLDYCKMNGPFEAGNKFILKPKRGPAVKIELMEVIRENTFTDCTKFFGAEMCNTHSVEEKDGGLLLSNKLVVTGPLKWLWIKLVAQNVANTVPEEMDALAAVARGLYA